ncbi:MAG: hypothetical protein HKL85_11780 [Acidimicrobiaceae bacterium]|nr:hypothetical protein [Acidimicrobiaceae bacterium]
MHSLLCFVNPVGCATSSLAKATLGDLFGALTSWVLSSVAWLLHATGSVLNSAGEPTAIIHAASPEFLTLATVSPILLLIGMLVSTLHSLRHGDSPALWRSFLGVAPVCVFAIVAARPLAALVLDAVNQLCATAGSSLSQGEVSVSRALLALSLSPTPGFGLFILASLVVVGGVLLWCELIIRAVVLTLLIVLVPVVMPLVIIPVMRRVGWRLVETFLGVALSKFLIVVTLALGLSELTGTGATTVITGAVTLILASVTPFVILRLIPLIETSALNGVEGLRQRATRAVASAPSSPAGMAVAALAPTVSPPSAPERPEDWGIAMWEPGPDFEMPDYDGTPPPAPVGDPLLRKGHVAYYSDDGGPVVGWHFDE